MTPPLSPELEAAAIAYARACVEYVVVHGDCSSGRHARHGKARAKRIAAKRAFEAAALPDALRVTDGGAGKVGR